MDVVIEDDDPDHHAQAERDRLLACESAAVLPEGTHSCVSDTGAASHSGGGAILTAFPA